MRTSPGHYVIAPPQPKAPTEPPPPPNVTSDGHPIVQWREWLETWFATRKWNGPGGPPGSPDFVAPMDVLLTYSLLQEAHEKERDAAEQKGATDKVAAAQAMSDAKLLEKLPVAANGNFVAGARIRDLTPIRVMLSNGAILEDIVSTLEARVDRRAAPDARPLTPWSDHWLLCAIAGTCLERMYVLKIVDDWIGKIPAAAAGTSAARSESAEIRALFKQFETRKAQAPAAPQPRPQEGELSDEAVDELLAGYCAGTLSWPRAPLGPEPELPNCRISAAKLRQHGLA